MDTNTIIEGTVKFRDGKKWKSRWCVMRKLSPVADCLHLQLYRDSRDRYKHGLTKASLSLQHFLGLETGFTLDKESNTVAIICQDLIVVLAFDTRERLIQWQVKIYNHLGEDQQFLIQISSSPPKAKLSAGPAKLHIQERRFCLTTGVPPKLAGYWEIKHLRRFGVIEGKFCFEGGSLCGRGEGLYIFLTDQGDEITRSVQLASDGRLNSLRRPLLRNMPGQHESPRRGTLTRAETRLSEISCCGADGNCTQQTVQRVSHHERTNQGWPSMETQADVYGHGDTTSMADFSIDAQSTGNWNVENQLGRCVSCIGKLGLVSRPSTAANTPGSINFNPWPIEDSKISLTGMQHDSFVDEMDYHAYDSSCMSAAVSQKSGKFSQGSSSTSGTECSDQALTSSLDATPKIFHQAVSTPQSLVANNSFARRDTDSPPCRPPKPAKFRNYPESNSNTPAKKRINKPPMPLPPEADERLSKTLPSPPCRLGGDPYDNYDSPKSSDRSITLQTNGEQDTSKYYDTPRSIKIPVHENTIPFANYDIPPAAVPLVSSCARTPKMKIVAENEQRTNAIDVCFCHQLLRFSHQCMQLPLHLAYKSQWQNLTINRSLERRRLLPPLKETPVYAQVDLSKKIKNRSLKETNDGQRSNVDESPPSSIAVCDNYTNIKFRDEDRNYEHIAKLNYMNLEFTNSLKFYENVRELMHASVERERIDSLNIDVPATATGGDVARSARVCRKCGHGGRAKYTDAESSAADAPSSSANDDDAARLVVFENYVAMSPLKNGDRPSSASDAKWSSSPSLSHCERHTLDGRQRKISAEISSGGANKYSTLEPSSSTHATRVAPDCQVDSRKCCDSAGGTANDGRSTDNNEDDDDDPDPDSKNENTCRIPAGDSDSGLESDKLSQENDHEDAADKLRHRKEHHQHVAGCGMTAMASGVRRLTSIGCKSSNRDSSSSNDSGFSSGSLKYHPCQDFSEFEMPLTTAVSAKRHHSFNQQHFSKNDGNVGGVRNGGDNSFLTGRRTKSSDPLRDLAFQFHKSNGTNVPLKSSSAEAELPLYLDKRELYKDCTSPPETTVSVPYVDCRSTSSGTSDMSDYIETLSISSHSSSDVHSTDAVRLHQSVVTTLKPRSGNEYRKVDRISLLDATDDKVEDGDSKYSTMNQC